MATLVKAAPPHNAFVTHAEYRAAVAMRPEGYAAEFEACIVERIGHGIWFDTSHHAYHSMMTKYKGHAPTPKQADQNRTPEQIEALQKARAERLASRGRELWTELHQRADADQKWLKQWLARVPCGTCKQHARMILGQLPPVFGDGWFAWTVEFHNKVNETLGKPIVSLDDAVRQWCPST